LLTWCTGSWKQGGTLRDAVLRAIPQLRGAYGTVIMDSRDPSTLLAARSGSPMVIGLGMGENFIASDQLALLPVTRRFIFLEEGDIAEVTRRSVTVFDTKGGGETSGDRIQSAVRRGRQRRLPSLHAERDLRAAERHQKHPDRAYQPR
jgi:glucosamine--fructose-6-phosphate aminotransferase (isomerizing)